MDERGGAPTIGLRSHQHTDRRSLLLWYPPSPAMMISSAAPEAATRLLQFVNASPTPLHAVATAALRLEKAGFRKVRTLDLQCLLFADPGFVLALGEGRLGERYQRRGQVLLHPVRLVRVRRYYAILLMYSWTVTRAVSSPSLCHRNGRRAEAPQSLPPMSIAPI